MPCTSLEFDKNIYKVLKKIWLKLYEELRSQYTKCLNALRTKMTKSDLQKSSFKRHALFDCIVAENNTISNK